MRSNKTNVFYFVNGSIGDFLMGASFLNSYHGKYPDHHVFVITPRNSHFMTEILQKPSFVDIIELSRSRPWNLLFVFKKIFGHNLVILYPSLKRYPIRVVILGKFLTLFNKSQLFGICRVSDRKVSLMGKLFPFDIRESYYGNLINLLEFFGVERPSLIPRVPLSDDQSVIRRFGLAPNQYVVLHPGAATIGRSLAQKEIYLIIRILLDKSGLAIVVTGDKKDFSLLGEHFVYHNYSPRVINCFGVLSASELSSLVAHAHSFVGVDSGITHLAAILKKKILVIAHHGTPHWLPFYNHFARIVYSVDGCRHGVFEGKSHLAACGAGRIRPLLRVPLEVIKFALISFYDN